MESLDNDVADITILVNASANTCLFKINDGTGDTLDVNNVVDGSGKFMRGTFSYKCVN